MLLAGHPSWFKSVQSEAGPARGASGTGRKRTVAVVVVVPSGWETSCYQEAGQRGLSLKSGFGKIKRSLPSATMATSSPSKRRDLDVMKL